MKKLDTNYENNLLTALRATVPEQTETYSPIPHSVFLQSMKDKLYNKGYEISSQKLYTDSSGNKLVGFCNIKNSFDFDNQYGMEMMAGWRNSYDKSMPVALAIGANIIVCGNGMVCGDLLAFKKRHRGAIMQELNEKIDLAIVGMESTFRRLVTQAEVMKNYDLTRRQKSEILGIMYFDKEIVSSIQLNVIKNEIKNSEHFKGNTMWDLYNNVTESLKISHPIRLISDHIRLHDFMLEMTGITEAVVVEEPLNADTGSGLLAPEFPAVEPRVVNISGTATHSIFRREPEAEIVQETIETEDEGITEVEFEPEPEIVTEDVVEAPVIDAVVETELVEAVVEADEVEDVVPHISEAF